MGRGSRSLKSEEAGINQYDTIFETVYADLRERETEKGV